MPKPTPPTYLPIPIPTQQSQTPQISYQPPTALLNALQYLMELPSVPIAMRQQFYVLWENVIFGNFSAKDILYLMSKFREWCILLQMYIPEQKWGNLISFQDTTETTPINLDLNLLLNTLTQLYFINLSRGKEGFTVKELTTMRSFIKTGGEESEKEKRELKLF
jgi:hypothetical protein